MLLSRKIGKGVVTGNTSSWRSLFPGGGAESVDLTPSGRRVLHAQQMLLGTRAAGLVGPPTAPPPYVSPAPYARTQGPPNGVPKPSPYGVAQRSKQRSGGAGSSGY